MTCSAQYAPAIGFHCAGLLGAKARGRQGLSNPAFGSFFTLRKMNKVAYSRISDDQGKSMRLHGRRSKCFRSVISLYSPDRRGPHRIAEVEFDR